MKLKYQLFITLLILSALLIALMLGVSSWSFNRGFLSYVNNNERAKLKPLVAELATLYESEGGWHWTENNKQRWHEIIIRNIRPKSIHFRPTGQEFDRSRRRSKQDRPTPRIRYRDPTSKRNRQPPPPREAARLVLTDEEKKPLFGKYSTTTNLDWLPISSKAQIVGYLGHKRNTQLNRQIDQVFAQQQRRSFAYAALGMILFSGLLSVPLGSRIVQPLLKINKAVNQINQGNFDYRVSSNRNDELGDLARNINNLGFTLEQNLAARQRWIAEISHELRTPLAVLQSELEAIQDGLRTANPDAINSLHTEVMRLNHLINDLHQLSLSDIGGLEYQMQSLSMDKVVSTYLQANANSIESASIRLNFNTDNAQIFGDHQRLIQLLDNLLQNTIRYTTTPGILDVSVVTTSQDAILKWADSSPGVTDKDHRYLFDALYRSDDSRNRENGGSGLGLAIVKKIVEAHSGHIDSQHSKTGGLEIIISMPLFKERSS